MASHIFAHIKEPFSFKGRIAGIGREDLQSNRAIPERNHRGTVRRYQRSGTAVDHEELSGAFPPQLQFLHRISSRVGPAELQR